MVLEFKQIKVARGVPKGALGFLKGTLAYPEDDLGGKHNLIKNSNQKTFRNETNDLGSTIGISDSDQN